jgi:phosphohistidine phosphatase
MELYLMQHGEAVTEAEDPARPLSERGRADVERVAEQARAAGIELSQCVHSGKLRAEQSAQILAARIAPHGRLIERPGLAPNDPLNTTVEWLQSLLPEDRVAVVGHLPYLGRLAAYLVTRDQTADVVRFSNGCLIKLVPGREANRFAVAWAFPARLA